MLPVFLSEPLASLKRQRAGKVLAQPTKDEPTSLGRVKEQLQRLRQHALQNVENLAKLLQNSLSQNHGVHVYRAGSAPQAGEYIRQICGSTSTIAVNKSAVVTKEIVPALGNGFQIVDSYSDQFPSFQSRFQNYWELPPMDFNDLELSFSAPRDLNPLREMQKERYGLRDFVGLLGVGAAAAAEGALFLLQHGSNITHLFMKANKLILVVGLGKIVPRADDAIFLTKCLALFGTEARLLDLHPTGPKGPNLEDLPSLPSPGDGEDLHVILLDNGRLNILASPYRDLLQCINCRACIRGCPSYAYFRGPFQWSPKEYVYSYTLGLAPSLDFCLLCGACRKYCPLEIDIPSLVAFSRSQKRHPLLDRMLANFEAVAGGGKFVRSFSNALMSNRAMRRMMDGLWGLSQERQLPDFQPESFVSDFRKRKE